MITGSIVALVTPMFEDGTIDFDSYRNLIEMHIAAGTDAIVAVGTTGESPTVDFDEHNELIKVAVEAAAGRIPVIAGTGSNSTREAIILTEYAKLVPWPVFRSLLTITNRLRKGFTSTSRKLLRR